MKYTDIGTVVDDCIYCGRECEVERYSIPICRKCEPYICERCGAYSQELEGFLCSDCREVDDGDNQERA